MPYLSIFASPLLAAKSVSPIPSHVQKFSAHNLCTTSQMLHAKQQRTTHHVNINMHATHSPLFLHDYFNVPLFEAKARI
jgi:hypothetical protein